MLANCFPRPNVAEWSARARQAAQDRELRTIVIGRKVLCERPARGLEPGNLALILSKGRVHVIPRPRVPADQLRAPKPERARTERPALASDRYRRDRLAERVRAPQTYHAAPEAIGAGRI